MNIHLAATGCALSRPISTAEKHKRSLTLFSRSCPPTWTCCPSHECEQCDERIAQLWPASVPPVWTHRVSFSHYVSPWGIFPENDCRQDPTQRPPTGVPQIFYIASPGDFSILGSSARFPDKRCPNDGPGMPVSTLAGHGLTPRTIRCESPVRVIAGWLSACYVMGVTFQGILRKAAQVPSWPARCRANVVCCVRKVLVGGLILLGRCSPRNVKGGEV
jgi:hypothetical protein